MGNTVVSNQMIDCVTAKLGRKLCEVPVGFKWFVDSPCSTVRCALAVKRAQGLLLAVWMATDKDGIISALLAAPRAAIPANLFMIV